jgi:hypothetical protein
MKKTLVIAAAAILSVPVSSVVSAGDILVAQRDSTPWVNVVEMGTPLSAVGEEGQRQTQMLDLPTTDNALRIRRSFDVYNCPNYPFCAAPEYAPF